MTTIYQVCFAALVVLVFSGCKKDPITTITKIKITSFPPNDYNGVTGTVAWDEIDPFGADSTGAPDIFPMIYESGNHIWTLPSYQTNRYLNAKAGDNIQFDVNLAVDNDKQYNIKILDYDEYTENDTMGSAMFVPSNYTINETETAIEISSGSFTATVYATQK